MMKKLILVLVILCVGFQLSAQDFEYKYRLTLRDKGTEKCDYKAEQLFSQKAIERRLKQNIAVDITDYPISPKYLKQIEKKGGRIVAQSKWNSTVAVHVKDSLLIDEFKEFSFVEDVRLVWKGMPTEIILDFDSILFFPMKEDSLNQSSLYGSAFENINILNGAVLHEAGYKGDSMIIAVIDAGFKNLPKIEYLDSIKLLEYKSFVDNSLNIFLQSNEHGTNVLSCMATNKPYKFVGTAPEATYLLLNSEDYRSEYPIEEDYWAAAIEYADSIGVDVVNTSLGYINYDAPIPRLTHDVLDGKKSLISRAANRASKKGILIVASAGNAGGKEWKKVSPPGDAEGILTVGAIQVDSVVSFFSSIGLTADLRIKPDVMSLGTKAAVINSSGKISQKNGTSFASPIMCGLAACLWQAFPSLNNYEIIDVIRESADRYEDPNVKYGFGIPNMRKAMELAEELSLRKINSQ